METHPEKTDSHVPGKCSGSRSGERRSSGPDLLFSIKRLFRLKSAEPDTETAVRSNRVVPNRKGTTRQGGVDRLPRQSAFLRQRPEIARTSDQTDARES